MRWLGPVFGDLGKKGASGQNLAPFIRGELGKLLEFMELGRITTYTQTRRLVDGTRIILGGNLNGASPILNVKVYRGSISVREAVSSLLLESGLMQFPIGELGPASLFYPESVEARYTGPGMKEGRFLDYLQIPGAGLVEEELFFNVLLHTQGRDSLQYPSTSVTAAPAIVGNHSIMTGKAGFVDQCKPGLFAIAGGIGYATTYATYMGMYTTNSGVQYYWLKIQDNKVYSLEVEFTRVGVLIQNYLQTFVGVISPDYYKKTEGYLFTQVGNNPVSAGDHRWTEIGNIDIQGSSTNGYKFNWKGNKISVVTQEWEYVGAEYSRTVARLYNITVSEVGAELSASYSLEEEKGWRVSSNYARIFVPTGGASSPFTQHSYQAISPDPLDISWTSSADTDMASGIPVDCWYDKDGKIIIARFKYYNHPSKSSAEVTAEFDAWIPTVYLCGAGTYQDTFNSSRYVSEYGFYIDYGESAQDYSEAADAAMVKPWPVSGSGTQKTIYKEERWANTLLAATPQKCTNSGSWEENPGLGYYSDCGAELNNGNIPQWTDADCPSHNPARISIDHTIASFEYKYYSTFGAGTGGLRVSCLLLPYHNRESAGLFVYETMFGGTWEHRKHETDGVSVVRAYDDLHSIAATGVARVPYETFGHGISALTGNLTVWSYFALPGPEDVWGDETTYFEGDDEEAQIGGFRHVFAGNDGAELIKEVPFGDMNDATVYWGDNEPYTALINVIPLSNRINIATLCLTSALYQERFRSDEWGVNDPPAKHTNTNLDENKLGPTIRWVGNC